MKSPIQCRVFRQNFALAIVGLLGCASVFAAGETRDAKSVEIANSMMTAMGGKQAWDSAKLVRYDFQVTREGKLVANRSHLWNKMTGRYRYETKTKDGKSQIVLFQMPAKTGDVWEDGKKLDGDAAGKAVEGAYKAFINDMYWLAMPWKWLDDGVNLKYMGKKPSRGESCDLVELTFKQVGLTPGDRYHAFVSPQSHLMVHWEYTLQSGNQGSWDWDYAETHGLKLAKNHTDAKGNQISMGDVRVLDSVDGAYFTDPAKMLSGLQ